MGTRCYRDGCTNRALYHVRGGRIDDDVCDPHLADAQRVAGMPRETRGLPPDDGQDALFDLPAPQPARRNPR